MLTDGERLRTLLQTAHEHVLLSAPFIKAPALRILLASVPPAVEVRIVTRWRPMEVACGVADLEVFEIANDRPHTQLDLLDALHAKLYLADDKGFVGSANLTATALGWSDKNNLEILVPVTRSDDDVTRLLEQLETSIPATYAIRTKVESEASAISGIRMDEGRGVAGDESEWARPWLPRCAAPQRLYEMYLNPGTDQGAENTRVDGALDLRDMQITNGLSKEQFEKAVRDILVLMPAFRDILNLVPKGLTDADGALMVGRVHSKLTKEQQHMQWRIVRDWIGTFFSDQFEVAAQSFVVRLRRSNQ